MCFYFSNTYSSEFWKPLLENPKFKEFLSNQFKLNRTENVLEEFPDDLEEDLDD